MLQNAIQNVFVQLTTTLDQLNRQQYSQPCRTLFNATIGQHVRHIIELFQCLENGYASGSVNYEKRKRDTAIETNPQLAVSLLKQIYTQLNRPDKQLQLECAYDEGSPETVIIATNYFREIVYNLEHTIHHMALIRVGIKEVANVQLPENFGVAPSTSKYRQSCAQ
ncbi:MAG TPA: hypothetical protein VFS36_05365 [Chitinophagaceae bacterium]|jgi:hypothetical protein|nr:hypothetical protein [Chitinophagaceae bacterium]